MCHLLSLNSWLETFGPFAWDPVIHLFVKYLSSVARVPRAMLSAGNVEDKTFRPWRVKVRPLCLPGLFHGLPCYGVVCRVCPRGRGARR